MPLDEPSSTNEKLFLTLSQNYFTNFFTDEKNLCLYVHVRHVRVRLNPVWTVNLNFALHGPEEVNLLLMEC